jgi:hypothetical protein
MDINTIANKIADAYLKSSCDMNDSIAKYASDNNLSIEHTKRLVEEANKQCYLMKLAATGEQLFDVAHYDEVKKKFEPTKKIEKKAELIAPIDYNGTMTKVASEKNDSYTLTDIRAAINCCRERKGKALTKLAELRCANSVYDPNEEMLKPHLRQVEIQDQIISSLEKKASLISGLAGASLKGGAAITGQAAKTMATHPMKSMMLYGSLQEAKGRAMKTSESIKKNFISNTPNMEKQAVDLTADLTAAAGEMGREAAAAMGGAPGATAAAGRAAAAEGGFFAGIGKNLKGNVLPLALTMGAVGLTAAAARGIGGVASRMMRERQLNKSFDTMMQVNADIRQIPHARDYFDVIARHSPSLALDPMVAPQLIRNFDSFGGVDVNTVGKLRDIENAAPKRESTLDITSNYLGGMDRVKSFAPDKLQHKLNLAKIIDYGRKKYT